MISSSKRCRGETYTFIERAVDRLSEKLPSVAASCNASRAARSGSSGSSTCVYALEAPSRRATRETGERETQEGMHTTRKQRGALSHDECVLCPTRTRARAPFPVFGSHVAAALSTVTRCDTCRTNSEIFATPCTRRYPRVAESAGNAPHA